MNASSKRIGLALGGGGGKGTAHIGVLSALEARSFPIDIVVGTSIGAIVGSLYAVGYSAQAIEEWFKKGATIRILERDTTSSGLIGTGRIESLLHDALGDRTFLDTKLPFAVVAVDLIGGEEVVLQDGGLVEAVMASMAVPGVFPPVRLDDRILIDGGVRNNVPVDVAFRLGADRVVAVDLGALTEDYIYPAETDLSIWSSRRWLPHTQLEIAERAIAILIAQITAQRLSKTPPSILLRPAIESMAMFDFTHIEEGRRIGERAVYEQQAAFDTLERWYRDQPDYERD